MRPRVMAPRRSGSVNDEKPGVKPGVLGWVVIMLVVEGLIAFAIWSCVTG